MSAEKDLNSVNRQSPSRRAFLRDVAIGAGVVMAAPAALFAQQRGAVHEGGPPMMMDSTNLFPMNQDAAVPVQRPPKPGAKALMTNDERDALEHRIRCQCGCTLDVYTCRTTDFSCQVSPAMHRDVMALVDGGYSPDEIIAAFVGTYGERVLMAPTRSGFNLVGWILPSAAVVAGAAAVTVVVRRWGVRSAARRTPSSITPLGADASAEELARIEAAVRGDD